MARFNRWQNGLLLDGLRDLSARRLQECLQSRGAALGELLSEGLAGDLLWLRRLEPVAEERGASVPDRLSPQDFAQWRQRRRDADARLVAWAARQTTQTLDGFLFYRPSPGGGVVSSPLGLCLSEMFWTQAHCRGRIAAELAHYGLGVELPGPLHLPEEDIALTPDAARAPGLPAP